jgi:Arc/MetJ family transcription regulator
MRTNIDIDEKLLASVMKSTGLKTKRETVHEALRRMEQLEAQKEFRKLRGKINWIGDLDEMRRD